MQCSHDYPFLINGTCLKMLSSEEMSDAMMITMMTVSIIMAVTIFPLILYRKMKSDIQKGGLIKIEINSSNQVFDEAQIKDNKL